MLKKFDELYAIDVRPYCDTKKGRDDKGREIEIPYLNWAKCVKLLHENGAESVYFTPIKNADGSYLFTSRDVVNVNKSKESRTTGCYFVSVEIHIDDLVFTQDLPLMNGTAVVYDDSLNQLRISNAHARAFVKGVAIRTGLGFSLWTNDIEDERSYAEDIGIHNIMKIRDRIQERLTALMKSGKTIPDICTALGIKEKNVQDIMNNYFTNIAWFEDAINKL